MTMENRMPSFQKKQRQDQSRGHLKYQRAHKRDRSGSQTVIECGEKRGGENSISREEEGEGKMEKAWPLTPDSVIAAKNIPAS